MVVMTAGLGESFLAEKIEAWENALPPHQASLPAQPGQRAPAPHWRARRPARPARPDADPPTPLRERIGSYIFAEEDSPWK
ncbi:MAG: hypothetical protein WKG07_36465 [Hymenobacter sp.]